MAIRRIESHWRDSARTAQFFFIDAKSAFPLLIFLMHITWWTFWVALVITAFFGIIEHYGLSALVFWRIVRNFFAGHQILSRPWWRQERFR